MIIVVLAFFCGQLTAEEVVGVSIFPSIELPNPYLMDETYNKTVWSTTIRQSGASWIKIHFSKFRLNRHDYLDMIDMKGKVIERIRMVDVAKKHHSKFNVKNNKDRTFSFWGPAIDGNRVKVVLHRKSNKKTGWGFTIDEVGVGIESIFDNGVPNRERIIDSVNKPFGRMLYRKGATWYTCNGILSDDRVNHFLPSTHCINSRDVVDTLEVRFYINYPVENKSYTVYYTYYGDDYIDDYSTYDCGLLTLKNNLQMTDLHSYPGYPNKIPNISEIYDEVYDYCFCDCICDCYDEGTCCSCDCSCSNCSSCGCNCCSGSATCDCACCCGNNTPDP